MYGEGEFDDSGGLGLLLHAAHPATDVQESLPCRPLFPEGFLFLARFVDELAMFDVTVGIGWHIPIPMPQVGLEPG